MCVTFATNIVMIYYRLQSSSPKLHILSYILISGWRWADELWWCPGVAVAEWRHDEIIAVMLSAASLMGSFTIKAGLN